ncbi:MAG: SymE family type I addiction module toxin [Ferruginibacter sp.]
MGKQASAKTRRLTVCNKGFARGGGPMTDHYIVLPILSLTGKWLKETGFEGGHVVEVACEQGRLTITLAKEQRFKGR